jgi:hypothetical protein
MQTRRQMNSRTELSDFLHDFDFENDSAGTFSFRAMVAYDAASKSKCRARVETHVRANLLGYDDGVVHIDEAQGLKVKSHHLEFRPDFQDYVYDRKGEALVISGKSAKMGGSYSVKITPLGYTRRALAD